LGGLWGFFGVGIRKHRGPFALATMLRRRGVVNDDELRDAIERLPPQQYLAAPYYERWLGALEMLVAEKGVA